MFAAIAISAIAASGIGLAQRTPPPAKDPHAAHKAMFEDCAKACHDCQRLCDACAHHCAGLVAQGNKEHVKTMQTCQDCAAFCAMAARIVGSHGPFADISASSCATACERCAVACEEFGGDGMMKKCAEECRRCEKSCRQMNGNKTVEKTAPAR